MVLAERLDGVADDDARVWTRGYRQDGAGLSGHCSSWKGKHGNHLKYGIRVNVALTDFVLPLRAFKYFLGHRQANCT